MVRRLVNLARLLRVLEVAALHARPGLRPHLEALYLQAARLHARLVMEEPGR